jgi:hypothetical protein
MVRGRQPLRAMGRLGTVEAGAWGPGLIQGHRTGLDVYRVGFLSTNSPVAIRTDRSSRRCLAVAPIAGAGAVDFSLVMIPALAAPMALLLHFYALRNYLRDRVTAEDANERLESA